MTSAASQYLRCTCQRCPAAALSERNDGSRILAGLLGRMRGVDRFGRSSACRPRCTTTKPPPESMASNSLRSTAFSLARHPLTQRATSAGGLLQKQRCFSKSCSVGCSRSAARGCKTPRRIGTLRPQSRAHLRHVASVRVGRPRGSRAAPPSWISTSRSIRRKARIVPAANRAARLARITRPGDSTAPGLRHLNDAGAEHMNDGL